MKNLAIIILTTIIFVSNAKAESLFDYLNDLFSPQSVFVVNTTGNEDDQIPGDGFCDDGSGNCSLRGAIQEANAFPGANVINFNIPTACPHVIVPNTPLPAITETVTIDGYSEPESLPNASFDYVDAKVCIQISGVSAGSNNGFTVSAPNTVIRGLAISSFALNGILVDNLGAGSTIEGNFIGFNADGIDAQGNRIGILVQSTGVKIGGTTLPARNLISNSTRYGVSIFEASNNALNQVQNNFIGLDRFGNPAGNGESGLQIFRSGGNIIGGTAALARNIISSNGRTVSSGFDGSGIYIFGDLVSNSPNNTIQGNYIGLDSLTTSERANKHNGIKIDGAIDTQIGGTNAGATNTISSNLIDGISLNGTSVTGTIIQNNYIGLDKIRQFAFPNGRDGINILNSPSNTIGGTATNAGNWIGGNVRTGLRIDGTDAQTNIIKGNFIGYLDKATQISSGQPNGIVITSSNNTIGGTVAVARNFIAGNPNLGIAVALGASNTIQGNYVGLTHTGETLGNGSGVFIQDASSNLIGGTNAGAGNLISGNIFGIRLITFGLPVANNTIQGNFVGTNPNGTAAIPNTTQGILLQGATLTTIGGTTAFARNVISGNTSADTNAGQGISIQNNSTNNTVLGNYIGTTADGLSALPNNYGVAIVGTGSTDNVIGGTAAGAKNVISGNRFSGVAISGETNRIEGNLIGLKSDNSAPLPNQDGVRLFSSFASNNVIGGTIAGAGNIISGNSRDGVSIDLGANNNRVEGNKIGSDSSGVIDFGNVFYGVHIQNSNNGSNNATQNTIGGSTDTHRNLVSGNNSGGIFIEGTGSTNNLIAGNYVGSQADGINYLANSSFGVRIASPNNIIGGATNGHRNIISGQFVSSDYGIFITNLGTGTKVQNNYVGINANGNDYLFNGIGVYSDADNTQVDSNVISGSFFGLVFGTVTNSYVSNNKFGTNSAGNAFLGNNYSIYLNNSSGVQIGQDSIGNAAPNIIAGSNKGITIVGGGTGNLIRQNSIYDNNNLGIDIDNDGVTQNDNGDNDLTANNRQNFPNLTTVTTTINGNLNSKPNRQYRLEFFNSLSADSSGYGEGKTFITNTIVSTDASGNATFSIANPISVGGYISSTATDLTTGDTSEFSAYKQVLAPTAVRFNGAKADYYKEKGVLVEWQTGLEVNNLGFNVYRETDGKRELITPNLIAGSSLLTEANLQSEQNYSWFDKDGTNDSSYVVEAIDTDGSNELFGNFNAETTGTEYVEKLNSKTFADVNNSIEAKTKFVEAKGNLPKKPTQDQLAVQNAISKIAGVKIAVKQAGFYRISASDLFAKGLDSNANPLNLQMFADGIEQPINIVGGGDGKLDTTDSIEFYGIGTDTTETLSRIYYLTVSKNIGKRLKRSETVGQPSMTTAYIAKVERKDRTIYISSLLNGDSENFFGAIVNNNGVDQIVNLPNVAQGFGNSEIFVKLQGVTKTQHIVGVILNGTPIGTIDFAQLAQGELRGYVDTSLLREGANTIRLTANSSSDIVAIDKIQIAYPRFLKAVNNSLNFTANSGQNVTIRGFTNENIRIIDVTDANSPFELAVELNKSEERGKLNATITPIGNGLRSLIAVSAYDSNAEITSNYASNLIANKGFDLIIISPREFFESLQPLISLRQSQGLRVMLIDVADIYDEFSFGQKSSYSIRNFLSNAYTNWARKPKYVLFAGDASYDQKGYLGNSDRLQTKLVDTLSMETASDEWFGDFNDDGVAEFAIGRLTAQTSEQMSAIVAKIASYENQTPSNSATFVSDMSDGFDFSGVNNAARGILPNTMNVNDLQRNGTNDATIHANLLSSINSGQKLISYIGHGSASLWRGNIFTKTDAQNLANRNNLPVFLTMTCLNGYFQNPTSDSLAETLLKNPDGGSVAVWTSSATTLPDSYSAISLEIHRALLSGKTLGDAHLLAKQATTNGDVRQTWILLGDPSMRLR